MIRNKRAISDDAKEARRESILNAALELFLSSEGALPTVNQIANSSNVAKGTIYLYFETREEIFFALMARYLDDLLTNLSTATENAHCLSEPMEVIIEFVLNNRDFLRLANLGSLVLEHNVDAKSIRQFKSCLYRQLLKCAASLNQRFPQFSCEQAQGLLHHSYSFLLGIWQTSHAPRPVKDALSPELLATLYPPLEYSLRTGLSALWNGYKT